MDSMPNTNKDEWPGLRTGAENRQIHEQNDRLEVRSQLREEQRFPVKIPNAGAGGVKLNQRTNKLNFSEGSWVDRVRIASKNFGFKLDQIDQDQERTSFEIPSSAIAKDQDEWMRCLIGFIPGYTMPFLAVKKLAEKAWGSYGLESVKTVKGFLIFRFSELAKLQQVLDDGPWLFGNKAMVLQQWRHGFVFDKKHIKKLPVWIRLHNLPFSVWTQEGLSFVASIVGKPIACDPATHHQMRLDYARICVEVDATKKYKTEFELTNPLFDEPVHVHIEYEWQPKRCPQCCVFGHICSAVAAETSKIEIGSTSNAETKEGRNQNMINGGIYQNGISINQSNKMHEETNQKRKGDEVDREAHITNTNLEGMGMEEPTKGKADSGSKQQETADQMKAEDGSKQQETAESNIIEKGKAPAVHDWEKADMRLIQEINKNTEKECCTPEVGVKPAGKSDTDVIIGSERRRKGKEGAQFLDLYALLKNKIKNADTLMDSDESSASQEDESQQELSCIQPEKQTPSSKKRRKSRRKKGLMPLHH